MTHPIVSVDVLGSGRPDRWCSRKPSLSFQTLAGFGPWRHLLDGSSKLATSLLALLFLL